MEDQIGTIEKEKSADIVVVNGDPSTDISTLHDVNTILSQGNLVKSENNLLI